MSGTRGNVPVPPSLSAPQKGETALSLARFYDHGETADVIVRIRVHDIVPLFCP